jgi:hypothetical protein
MVDRRAISPRQFAGGMYVPEENADFQALREDPEYNRKLVDAALQASMLIPISGAVAGGAGAVRAAPGMLGRASEYARGLEAVGSKLSPAELAVIQAKYPGRFINPQTGFPQSVRNMTGQTEAAMGATRDPFAGLIEGAEAAPGAVRDYLTKPRPVVNPETGYQLRNMEQGANWGRPLTEWTPGQRLAQTAAVGAPVAAATYALSPSRAVQASPDAQGSTQFQAGAGRGSEVENAGDRYASMVGAGRGLVDEQPGERAKYEATQNAVMAARDRAIPVPPVRPQELREQPGGLARLFSGGDYQSKGGELRQDGRINWGDSDSAADFFRAAKAQQETPDAVGLKRGGAAGGKSEKMPDPIHKALEIIHHLLMRH